jgi:hypothetical protein
MRRTSRRPRRLRSRRIWLPADLAILAALTTVAAVLHAAQAIGDVLVP